MYCGGRAVVLCSDGVQRISVRGAALSKVQSGLQAIAVWELQLRSAEAVAERSYMRSKTKCAM